MNVRLMTVLTAVGVCVTMQSIGQDKGQAVERTPAVQEVHDNYTIQLRGGYLESAPVDLMLTGSGPDFRIDLCEPRLEFHATIEPCGDSVDVRYGLSMSLLITNGFIMARGGPSNQVHQVPNVESRRSSVSGSAVIEDGKPLAIVTLNQKKLELTVTKSKTASAEKR